MSIRKDLVIKISNGSASLDMPLQIYEKDHGIELRFKLMDYKYKYDKDPDNILNSNKEDILEAYTTIVNPSGYELAQINGEVIDDTVRFMIEDSYTDELEELGIYQLQIHVKCKHSEFSIPPVKFEVLERLKGEKVVTDGDDEVDNSDIIDGSTKFIDDETGKLIIKWQKGDTISSVRLNAMVEVINNAVDEEAQRQLNEVEREQQELEREQQELERESRLQAALDSADARMDESMNEYETRFNALTDSQQAALNSVDARVDESMNEYETRFNALTASQQQDMEVIDARDGEVSLKARLDRDLIIPLQVYEDVEGSSISCDSIEGFAQNVEILGNTIQDASNLADIRSVGDKVEGQELYEIPVLSHGKNLFNPNSPLVDMGSPSYNNAKEILVNGGIYYTYTSTPYDGAITVNFYKSDDTFISGIAISSGQNFLTPTECKKIKIHTDKNSKVQLEEGAVATEYEPYQEDKLTILSPVQLEKVGDVADRLIEKDGILGVEKNVVTKVLNGSEDWHMDNPSKTMFGATMILSPLPIWIETNQVKHLSYPLGTKIHIEWNNDFEGTHIRPSDNALFVNVYTNKLETVSIDGFKKWLQANPNTVKYPTTQPQFIPLPHDQQVKLRTFANKTNISFLTEIEGTIKAQIPKSLGATVNTHTEQINNLNKELDRVKKLEESTVSTVTTESDFTTVEATSNGYFEDVKLEGKTLVNLWDIHHLDLKGQAVIKNERINVTTTDNMFSDFICVDKSKFKPSTEYTIILDIYKNTLEATDYIYVTSNSGSLAESKDIFALTSNDQFFLECGAGVTGRFVRKCTTISDFSQASYALRSYVYNVSQTAGKEIELVITVLEGDHTQNPPSYFEGLKSVGQSVTTSKDGVDEISVASLDTTEDIKYHNNVYFGTSAVQYSFNPVITKSKYIYNNSDKPIEISLYDNNSWSKDIPIKPYECTFVECPTNVSFNVIRFTKQNGWELTAQDINNIVLISDYLIKVDKKPLLYYNNETQAWEKPILREWDSIEKHANGKYYYHQRSGEVVLNGSESWTLMNDFASKIYATPLIGAKNLLMCDKVQVRQYSTSAENYWALYYNLNYLRLQCPYATTDEFKQWLQTNNVTVVYQLAEEKVYECINIDLMTYEDETNFIVNTGSITPKTSLKVMCNINNVVRELQQKVSNLENYIQHVMIDALNNALNE